MSESGVVNEEDTETSSVPAAKSRPVLTGPTKLPVRPAGPTMQRRRQIGGVTRDGALNVIGALVAAFCLTLLLFGRLTALSGILGAVAVWYVLFLAIYGVLLSLSFDRPAVIDKLVTALTWSAAFLTFLALGSVIVYTIAHGPKALGHLNFFTKDMSQAGPLSGLDKGGLKHALVGTLWMMAISLALTVPLGLCCAVYLNEVGGRFARFVRTISEAMTALPSIVAGLFIYIAWIITLGFEHSGLAAALALSVMGLPIIIRAADVVLRLVPGNLREASAALGAPQWRTVRHVVIPTARSGLATAVILGAARMVGETSPVLLTAGYTTFLNKNPLQGPMVSLPLYVFEMVSSGIPNFIQRGYAAAAVLLVVVLVLFLLARTVGGRGPGQVTRRKARRLARASARAAGRYAARDAAFAYEQENGVGLPDAVDEGVMQ